MDHSARSKSTKKDLSEQVIRSSLICTRYGLSPFVYSYAFQDILISIE
jgi:hypothetical protein